MMTKGLFVVRYVIQQVHFLLLRNITSYGSPLANSNTPKIVALEYTMTSSSKIEMTWNAFNGISHCVTAESF